MLMVLTAQRSSHDTDRRDKQEPVMAKAHWQSSTLNSTTEPATLCGHTPYVRKAKILTPGV